MTDLTLKVSGASPKDVGRGLACIDPEEMKQIDADMGDIAEITGSQGNFTVRASRYRQNYDCKGCGK